MLNNFQVTYNNSDTFSKGESRDEAPFILREKIISLILAISNIMNKKELDMFNWECELEFKLSGTHEYNYN